MGIPLKITMKNTREGIHHNNGINQTILSIRENALGPDDSKLTQLPISGLAGAF